MKVARLGDEQRTFVFPAGVDVGHVLDVSGVDGHANTIKINGHKVRADKKITADCSIVAIGETKHA